MFANFLNIYQERDGCRVGIRPLQCLAEIGVSICLSVSAFTQMFQFLNLQLSATCESVLPPCLVSVPSGKLRVSLYMDLHLITL